MQIKSNKLVSYLIFHFILILSLSLQACNSGTSSLGVNKSNSQSLVKSNVALNQSEAIWLSDDTSPIYYRDSLESIPVSKFGLKRIVVTNNYAESLFALQFPNVLPQNITYDLFRTTCVLNNTQNLAPQESCVLVFQYLPLVQGESAAFDINVKGNDITKNYKISNTKNIPYSSRGEKPLIAQISFNNNKIVTIGGMNESFSLNYSGPQITAPISVALSTNSSNVNISANNCTFTEQNKSCLLSIKATRNTSGIMSIKATSSDFTINDLVINVTPINCTLVDDVKISPYKVPSGFELQAGKCLVVADQATEFVSVLKVTNNYLPEFTVDLCDIKNDPECDQATWVPLQGIGFDNYLDSIKKDAVQLCVSQSYYKSNIIGIPGPASLRFAPLTHGPHKGMKSLTEVSDGYLGAGLYLWDSLTYFKKISTDDSLYIETNVSNGNYMYLLSDDGKTELWDVFSAFRDFKIDDLSTGNNLCQFYAQWQ